MPWFNRPGARLKKKGASYLNDAELLALILGKGTNGENVIDLSHRLINTFTSTGHSRVMFILFGCILGFLDYCFSHLQVLH